MRILLKILIFCVIQFSACNCESLHLIGSRLLPTDANYKVYLIGNDLNKESIINVTLKSESGYESSKIYKDFNGAINENVEFEVPKESQEFYKLIVTHTDQSKNKCTKQSINVNQNNPMILIQSNKPVYKNGDLLKFRIFVLDQNMVPYNFSRIEVMIFDSKENFVYRPQYHEISKFGVYEGQLKIGVKPHFGTWKIQVSVDGNKQVKEFQVLKKECDTYEVFVDAPSKVNFVDQKISLNIQAKHSIDKIFTGTAKISATARNAKDSSVLFTKNLTSVALPNKNKILNLDIKDDLGISTLEADLIVAFEVEVIEDKTLKSEKVSTEVLISGNDELMTARIKSNSEIVGETILINVKTTKNFKNLNAVVFGYYGLEEIKHFPDADGRNSYDFTIELTQKMKPEATVFIFYIQQDGSLISHELSLDVGNTLKTLVQVSANPKEEVTLHVETLERSKVFVSVIDQNSAIFEHDGGFSRKYQSNSFILQPITEGTACDEDSSKEPENKSIPKKMDQKYFPEEWINEVIENDMFIAVEKKVPDSLTSWKVNVWSITPDKDFSLSKKESEIRVASDFALKVHVPSVIHDGEVLKVEFGVYNFQKASQNAQIQINVLGGDLMTETVESKSNIQCRTFDHQNQADASLSLDLPAVSMSEIQQVFIQPSSEGQIIIKFTATTENTQDEVTKIIEVKNRKELRTKVAGSYLIDLKDNGNFKKQINLEVPEDIEIKDVYVTISGNMLGPVMEDTSKFSTLRLGYSEHRADKLMVALIRAENLKSRNLELPNDLKEELIATYQDILWIMQRAPNPKYPMPKPIWLWSYLIRIIVIMDSYLDIDVTIAEIGLDVLRSKQEADGSYWETPVWDVRREIGSDYSKRFIFTANVVDALIAYRGYSMKYNDVLDKAISFLRSTTEDLKEDFEKVIIAHTFALYGDEELSKSIISSMENTYTTPVKFEKSTFVEIVSYLILTKLQHNEDVQKEVEWLLSQRGPDGSYYSTSDTALALEALNKFSISKDQKTTSLTYNIDDTSGSISDSNVISSIKLQPKNNIMVNVDGDGLGYVTVYYEYFEKMSSEVKFENFKIDAKTKDLEDNMLEVEVDVEIVAEDMNRTNLVLLEIPLPNGYQYVDHVDAKHIEMIEILNDRSLVIIYLDITYSKTTYKNFIKAVKVYDIEKPAKSTIKIYDYYRTNIRDELQYGHDVNSKACESFL